MLAGCEEITHKRRRQIMKFDIFFICEHHILQTDLSCRCKMAYFGSVSTAVSVMLGCTTEQPAHLNVWAETVKIFTVWLAPVPEPLLVRSAES